MAQATLLLHHIRRLVAAPAGDGQPDRELLRRFTQGGDHQAFAALLCRHGPMVWNACLRVLCRADDAEDVLQATFLVLLRKAATLRDQNSVGSWLYGVAHRLALRARSAEGVRRARESRVSPRPATDPLADLSLRETQELFDAALARLPEKYRAGLVLCYLEGLTQEEAARQLGCSRSTLKRRLEAGRARLRDRLVRHGLTLSAGLLAATVTRGAEAAVPGGVTAAVLRAAAGGPVGGRVACLAAQGTGLLLAGPHRWAAGLLLAVGAAVAGAAGLASCWTTGAPAGGRGTAIAEPAVPEGEKPRARVDRFGDPLPDGALARIGTTRFRHGGIIQVVAFAADGKRLLSYGADGIRVWDAATGREQRHLLEEPGRRFLAPAFSADGKLAATTSVGEGGILRGAPVTLWDLTTGKKVKELGKATYCHVCFSQDGRLLAADRFDQVVETWDVATGKRLASWRAHEGRNRAPTLAFARDGKTLMTAGADQTVCFWEAATGKRLRRFAGVVNTEGTLALSPDGKWVAAVETKPSPVNVIGGEVPGRRVRILDATDGKELRRVEVPVKKLPFDQVNAVHHVTFSPDGSTLAGAAADGLVYLWDVTTGKERARVEAFAPNALAFAPDGKTVAVATWGNAIQIHDLGSGQELPRGAGLYHPALAAGLAPGGKALVVPDGSPFLALGDLATGELRRRRLDGYDGRVTSLLLSDDCRTLFAVHADGTLRTWDVAAGRQRRRIVLGDGGANPRLTPLACSPDGKQVVVHLPGLGGAALRVVNAATGATTRRLDPGCPVVHGATFLPDGKSLVVWIGDRKARVWDVAAGKVTRQMEYTEGASKRPGRPVAVSGEGDMSFFKAAVSPDGRLIAFGSSEDLIAIHDLAEGRELCRVEDLAQSAGCLAFSPDGRALAWGSWTDPRVHVLEVATGKERQAFAGHRGGVVSLVFSADGKKLISGGQDTTLLVWDLTGRAGARGGVPSPAEVEARWQELGGEDAARAHRAVRRLAAAGAPAVQLFRERIKPVAPPEEKAVDRLIADLDSDRFAVRQKAAADLERLGDLASGACRKALAARPSEETRRQLERLLKKQADQARNPSAERVRLVRALEVMEAIGTEEAIGLLTVLARGAPGAWLTEEAQAARTRLGRRQGTP
jgi:RNA polymerase sigma factor (sigma-70 family)